VSAQVSITVPGAFDGITKQVIFYFDHWRVAASIKLQGSANQVLEQLAHLRRISLDGPQMSSPNKSQSQQNKCAHDTPGKQLAVLFHVVSSDRCRWVGEALPSGS